MPKILASAFMIICLLSCANNKLKTIYVADHRVDCVGVAPQKCLLVKETEDGEWQNFYGHIEGFDYKAGYSYKLLVEVVTIENPPADASNMAYSLVEILEKNESPLLKLSKNNWKVVSIMGETNFESTPTMSFNTDESKVSGNAGCNRFFGTIQVSDTSITFGPLAATKMLCPDMSTEDQFFKTIDKIRKFRFQDDFLLLLSDNQDLKIKLQISH